MNRELLYKLQGLSPVLREVSFTASGQALVKLPVYILWLRHCTNTLSFRCMLQDLLNDVVDGLGNRTIGLQL